MVGYTAWTGATPVVDDEDRSRAYVAARVAGLAGGPDSFAQVPLPSISDGAALSAVQATTAYAFPTGSVKKEALYAALDDVDHLADLLVNLPPPLNEDGTANAAGWRLAYAHTILPADEAGQYIKERYFASDDTGFASLFATAGSGSTTPSTITVAGVTQSLGNSPTAVMSQAAVLAALHYLFAGGVTLTMVDEATGSSIDGTLSLAGGVLKLA